MKPDAPTRLWGLVRRRPTWRPTWRGWLVLVALCFASVAAGVRLAYPFLAVSDPVPGGVLVVEGWAPDYVIEAALTEYRTQRYHKLYVTGGPLERGAPLSEYRTYAELGAASLRKLGAPPSAVQPVPAPEVRQDRTYACAVALRHWLLEHGPMPDKVNVISLGPHARRTRLMFAQGLLRQAPVGIVAVESREYDPARWWASSQGVRVVLNELIAYAYVRLAFSPQAY
ncbi:MAG: YdcF family protein [Verrucomicrobia bacterium]|nr:YdcF family protein [Verrucomicrobiota bacterium]